MFTVIFTFVGLIVFLISICYTTFGVAFKRLLAFIVTGVLIDITMFLIIGTVVYNFA